MTFEICFPFVENGFKRQDFSDDVAVKNAFWNICISNYPFRFVNKSQVHCWWLKNLQVTTGIWRVYDSYQIIPYHMSHIHMNFKCCLVGKVEPDKSLPYFPKNRRSYFSILSFSRRPLWMNHPSTLISHNRILYWYMSWVKEQNLLGNNRNNSDLTWRMSLNDFFYLSWQINSILLEFWRRDPFRVEKSVWFKIEAIFRKSSSKHFYSNSLASFFQKRQYL